MLYTGDKVKFKDPRKATDIYDAPVGFYNRIHTVYRVDLRDDTCQVEDSRHWWSLEFFEKVEGNKMDLEQMRAELVKLQEAKDALEQQIEEAAKKPKLWETEDGEKYWAVSSGEVLCFRWLNDGTDQGLEQVGHVYPSEQSARDAFRAMTLEAKWHKARREGSFGKEAKSRVFKVWRLASGTITTWIYDKGEEIERPSLFGGFYCEDDCRNFIDQNIDELLWYFNGYLPNRDKAWEVTNR